ncbi:MAG: succinate--CoA ligase subunit alpha [candidate division Zixibacteria bacterium]|nr:succinate--CoA ligase subunit alpha [candidate division Zixibacteria bacterium]
MSILINSGDKVIVAGITGREGRARTRLMKGYGTNVVAGVSPGHGGEEVEGVPVFDTVGAAVEAVGEIYASVVFVPGPAVKEAALEAFDAGVKLAVLVPDRVPIWDVLAIDAAAREAGARYVGPNTLGVLSVGEAVLGMVGGSAESAREWFKPGPVGISSRSGGITASLAYYLGRAGVGATTLVHVGGDAVVGTPHQDVVRLFQEDADTKAVVLFGEIGSSQEEKVAELVAEGVVTKPVVAFIGGKAAREGTRFSHAGAIVEAGRGTYEGKVKALREAGAVVVDDYDKVAERTLGVLKDLGEV